MTVAGSVPPDLATALADADLIHDRGTLERAIARMAVRIRNDYAGSVPLFLTVMHGGMPFAAQLALELGTRGLDLSFDYLHATRYRGATSGGELVWKHRPATPVRGRRVLLVDDILDEGHTMMAIGAWCREQGAVDVRIAALAVKQHDRCVPGLSADYVGVQVPDRYVFGYGMDFHEQGRNLPGIYALGESA
ncbi:MAG: hypoxanthine-guanine phosphoribosyltransferase [Lysobacter sp.]|nr:hypoxanthine-guanine phosphoribosyltransferase [Lysobacter sp.]